MQVFTETGRVLPREEAGNTEVIDDPFAAVRGIVHGISAGIIIWTIILYLLIK
mgnify:CR=1